MIRNIHVSSNDLCDDQDVINHVSAGGVDKKHNPMGKGSLGEIVRWFKGRVKFYYLAKYLLGINVKLS